MPKVITLDIIVEIYAQLEANFLQLPAAITRTFPRDIDKLGGFLAGYSNQLYRIHEFDFYDTTELNPLLVPLRPEQRDVFSFGQIFGRKNPNPNSLDRVQRLVKIFVNTHEISPGNPLVNVCWNRFCQIKEMCQAILYEELNEDNPELYPITADYSRIVDLFSDINNKPFSLSDFGNENYPETLAIENAAELLASMLLIPVDDLVSFRQSISSQLGSTGMKSYNYFNIADYYKAPRRYVEVLITWDMLEDFVGKIKMARDGYLRAANS